MFLIKKVFQETLIKMKPKILVTRKLSDGAEEKLKKNFDVTLNLKDEPIPNNDLVKMANEYDGFISTGFDKIGEDFFRDLNGKLKIIAQVGVGYDNISVKSAESKKIKVTNTPNVLNEAVAETTILLILAASRRIGEAYNLVRSGKWKDQKPDLTKFMIGNSVTGKTLGIIGMGRIGRMAAKCAKAFGMKIIYYNRNKLSEDLEDGAKYFSDINSMMPKCDFVSIHTPATAETKHILNATTIKLLPKHAVVINTSRGSTIDDEALIQALQNNKIYAAGLDVFNNEPNLDERYMKLNNCFVLPHVGSATHETRLAMSMMAVDNLCNFFENKPLISEVV
jgi:glyoxylate reductase